MGGPVKNRNRVCKQCQSPFSIDDKNLRKYCSIECRNKYGNNKGGTKYRNSEKGKQSMRSWRLRTVFGITLEEFDILFAAQDHKCGICKTSTPTGYNWHVDHCHETQRVRGILCSKCNQGIGLLQDSPEIIRKAAQYLENSRNLS